MTKRELINKKLSLFYKLFYIGLTITFIGIFLSQSGYYQSALLQFSGVLLIIMSYIGSHYLVKCPSCNTPLKSAPTLNQLGFPKQLSKSFKHCPFCGSNYDKTYTAKTSNK